MQRTRSDVVRELRTKAVRGEGASALARLAIAQHPIEPLDRFLLADYFREAFCFAEGGWFALYGWMPDGTGELDDARLDHVLGRRIAKTRPEWEAALRASAA